MMVRSIQFGVNNLGSELPNLGNEQLSRQVGRRVRPQSTLGFATYNGDTYGGRIANGKAILSIKQGDQYVPLASQGVRKTVLGSLVHGDFEVFDNALGGELSTKALKSILVSALQDR